MNILLVGTINENVKKLSLLAAKWLNVTFVDAEKSFNQMILGGTNLSLEEMNSALTKKENLLIKKLNSVQNGVIYIPNDVFISNKNYLNLPNSIKIMIDFGRTEDISEKLEKFLKKITDKSIKFEEFNKENFLNILK